MKACLIVVLFGLSGLCGSTAVLAHNSAHGGAYLGIPLTGGITVWGNSHGRSGYAGNMALAYAGGYATVPYYGHAHGPSCGHVTPYGYARSYKRGYRYGRRDRRHHDNHHGRHHYNDHHGGRH